VKHIALILGKILLIAKDIKVWFRVLVLVIAGFAGAILFSRTKVKKEDCSYYIQMNERLVQGLLDIKKELSVTTTASYITFASYDTVKPKIKKQPQQVQKVLSKIDSLINQFRISQQQKSKL
tara:strand:- start:338 stop:703 length:366 start_codon:yes stop_codon:yes gene_type:complete